MVNKVNNVKHKHVSMCLSCVFYVHWNISFWLVRWWTQLFDFYQCLSGERVGMQHIESINFAITSSFTKLMFVHELVFIYHRLTEISRDIDHVLITVLTSHNLLISHCCSVPTPKVVTMMPDRTLHDSSSIPGCLKLCLIIMFFYTTPTFLSYYLNKCMEHFNTVIQKMLI